MFAAFAAARWEGGKNVTLNLPVRFAIDPTAYHIQRTDGSPLDATIDDASGDVTIKSPPQAAMFGTVGGVLLVEAVALLVLYRLRRIFRRLGEQSPLRGPSGNRACDRAQHSPRRQHTGQPHGDVLLW